jgi:hypothetical protein
LGINSPQSLQIFRMEHNLTECDASFASQDGIIPPRSYLNEWLESLVFTQIIQTNRRIPVKTISGDIAVSPTVAEAYVLERFEQASGTSH